MKRYVQAAINKRQAIDELLVEVRQTYRGPIYSVKPNYGANQIEIYDRDNNLTTIIKLKTVPVEVDRSKFRRATQQDIDSGMPLYVSDRYTTQTYKQIPEEGSVIDVSYKYDL